MRDQACLQVGVDMAVQGDGPVHAGEQAHGTRADHLTGVQSGNLLGELVIIFDFPLVLCDGDRPSQMDRRTTGFHCSGSGGPIARCAQSSRPSLGRHPGGGSRRPPRGRPGADADALSRSDGVQHLSAIPPADLRLERVGEPVNSWEPGIGVVLAVLSMTGNFDDDDVHSDVVTPVGAEGSSERLCRIVNRSNVA